MAQRSSHRPLINRSPDLQRLEDDGYDIEVRDGYILLKDVPYVTVERAVRRGTLISSYTLAGESVSKPNDHTVMFTGDRPYNAAGEPFTKIELDSVEQQGQMPDVGIGLIVKRTFSAKPHNGYADYYEKMTTYANILLGPAQVIDPYATAQPFNIPQEADENSVFEYIDTASSRAGIVAIANKLSDDVVAIVGLGGTGSYVLDLVAKTRVREIHLFDGDEFGNHNAFRSPGAASLDVLKERLDKATYFQRIYSVMRKNIVAHGHVDTNTKEELRRATFAFIAVDSMIGRDLAIQVLEEAGVPFVDVGMGVGDNDGSLIGQLRTTTSTANDRHKPRAAMPTAEADDDGVYSRNIQIADLNALNATLAVIKWKKLRGFYADSEREYSSYYQIDGNYLVNRNG